jgi:hypothetical protein
MIIYSVYRRNEWKTKTAETLAAEISAPAALVKFANLTSFFGALVAAGADAADLKAAWAFSQFIQRFEEALQAGSLGAVQALVATIPFELSAASAQALNDLIAANTLRLIDVVAAEQGEPAPESVSAADVTAALTEAGWAWDGESWVRA